jgi:tetratricopeptide (TPR) repeat protein
MSRAVIALAAILCASAASAHPEIENALTRLNAEIAATPNDADLYVERGELYARHEVWVFAEANYLRAAELAPDHPRLHRVRGELELATGHPADARVHFDAALARTPADAETRVLRARTFVALKMRNAAIADFNAALPLIATPPPELFLERAALLAPAEAIRSLDDGIERVGPAVTLNLRALALEESLGRIDDAVARLDRITDQSERKETWLKRRGDLLARAGRAKEARAAYERARAAIAALPDWLRESPDTLRLTTELARLTSARS